MVNKDGFMISEDLALGPETRLDHSGLLCGRSFITVKGTRKVSDINISKGMESAPLACLNKGVIYFSIVY